MPGLTLAMLNDKELAGKLAKRGTTSDIHMYNYRTGNKDLTVVFPEMYPDKLQPLFYALDMCDMPLVVVKELNAVLGEEIIAISKFGLGEGFVILDNYIEQEKWEKLTHGTCLSNYKIVEKDIPELLQILSGVAHVKNSDFSYIAIDHFFNVRGVGTVVLGVCRGGVQRHEQLRVYPTERVVEVRSIQVHDVDVEQAAHGERVGLALKGIEANELDRGYVLAKDGALRVTEKIRVHGEIEKFYKGHVAEGMSVHVYPRLAFVPARIENCQINGNQFDAEIVVQKPLAVRDGDTIILADLNAKMMRIMGSGTVIPGQG
jgi:selenocysteine-specific translation elongation factor